MFHFTERLAALAQGAGELMGRPGRHGRQAGVNGPADPSATDPGTRARRAASDKVKAIRGCLTGTFTLNLNSNLSPEQKLALEDQRLISGLQAGDEEAYEKLINRFQTPVYNFAFAVK